MSQMDVRRQERKEKFDRLVKCGPDDEMGKLLRKLC